MSSGRRILYLVDSLKVGGAEILVQGMTRAFASRGHLPSVAYFSHGPLFDELTAAGVDVTRVGRRGLADPLTLARLLGLIRRLRPEVIHTHLRKSDMLGQLAGALAGVPVRVSTAHNVDPWRRRKVLTGVHRLFTRRCQRVIAVSREVEEYLVRTRTFPADKIVTIENGIDLARFDPRRVEPLDRVAEWGIEPGAVAVGVIGRLEPQKGHDVLLEAAAGIAADRPEIRFVLVGDGSLRPWLEARASELGLEGRVIFAGISRDVPAALAALDVVTMPSLWEGLPLTLMEAMAMARPVVATAVGGVPELLEDGQSGLLVPSGDAAELARGLVRIFDDPGLASRLAAAAAETARERFDIEVMYERILDVYRRCREESCGS